MGDVTKHPPLSDLPGADLFPETLELPVHVERKPDVKARAATDRPVEGEQGAQRSPAPLEDGEPAGARAATDLHRVVLRGMHRRPERSGQRRSSDEPLPDTERSRLIGQRYRIVGEAGGGSTANVYKAVHLYLGKSFAIKAVHPGAFADADAEESFLREARVLSLLHHPNIIQVTDFGTDPLFGAYLVAEYLYGETLQSRMERTERLSVAFSLHLGLQIAEALHYMHQQKLIHCDIKPENLFLCAPPRGVRQRPIAKLIDFGLSHSIAHGTGRDQAAVGGTPLYAAPEQLAGQPPDPSMDIYAVGVLLYEMVTGELPFMGSVAEIVQQKQSALPSPPSVHLEKPLDDRLEELIQRALRPDPRKRQQNMGRLVFEIRTLMDMLGIHRASARRGGLGSSAARLGSRRRRRRTVMQSRIPHPFPMFQLDLEGRAIAASSSFLNLVGVQRERLRGLTLGQTLLGNVYPDIDEAITRAIEAEAPLLRTLTFETDDGRPAALLLWVVPQLDRSQSVECYAGVVVPLPSPDK